MIETSNKTLVVLTERFPYTVREEPFIECEVPFWKKEFARVVVIPIRANAENKKNVRSIDAEIFDLPDYITFGKGGGQLSRKCYFLQ